MASPISFQGLTTGLQTDQLVNAILQQEGQPLQRMQDRQTRNTQRATALQAIKTNLSSLASSLLTLGSSSFDARSVTSTDSNNTYVTASATGAAVGSYDLKIAQTASKGRLSPTLSYTGSSTNPGVLTFTGATAKTTTGAVGFTIDPASVVGGAVSGTFTVGGTNYTLTGTNGTLTGAVGSPLDGLSVSVNGIGSGTLNLEAVPTNLAVAKPSTTAIFAGPSAQFAVQGTDGVVKTLSLDSNSNTLYSLRDAINALGIADPVTGAKGLGVTATVVNTGSGSNPYQLILTANDTGTGTNTGGKVTIAEITPIATNTLGIAAGTLDNPTTPTLITGGLASSGTDLAQDAKFTVNGILLTRKSNTVTDAAEGVTFTLKQGGQTVATGLTVAQDKSATTSAIQEVISKFNALLKTYKDASGSGGALNNDSSARAIISSIRSALTSAPKDLSASAAFHSPADLGVKTNRDGTLSLDVTAFQAALDKDPIAAKRVFALSGVSTNGVVSLASSTSKTLTGPVSFNITGYAAGGAVTGTVNGMALSGTNGVLSGASGTPLEGLSLAVTGMGSGTLTISRGVGRAVQDLSLDLVSPTGNFQNILSSITDQNKVLTNQIYAAQTRLDRRKVILKAQFTQMEATVNQLQSAGRSLSGL